MHSMYPFLNIYIPYTNHVIDWNVIQVEQGGGFQVCLVHILDHKINNYGIEPRE
jgi:hypothetical protein